ncbi:hypothetical protein BAUCODRAFT_277848 [Baudoinia panamericana UAMH 10762]|uniref:Uncharacterized protein n=1 Tax=Baudoinia panamericana (strain UAMH 10762) TaxID=717646 RepID=M2MZQ0_BAUPA|nr:uncharacterized protein BAUCODRAFT_277848 [Baudoinia panamericana UAMH 10762]EMC92144.1 hypothetical protein BAUCODRAFT_277848 [Baudoinia panamericana UAMH 10762]
MLRFASYARVRSGCLRSLSPSRRCQRRSCCSKPGSDMHQRPMAVPVVERAHLCVCTYVVDCPLAPLHVHTGSGVFGCDFGWW